MRLFGRRRKRQGNLYLTKTGETVDDLILECQRDDRQSEDPDRPGALLRQRSGLL